jgi:hypothetical protein
VQGGLQFQLDFEFLMEAGEFIAASPELVPEGSGRSFRGRAHSGNEQKWEQGDAHKGQYSRNAISVGWRSENDFGWAIIDNAGLFGRFPGFWGRRAEALPHKPLKGAFPAGFQV